MIININDNWRIVSDPRQWIVEYRPTLEPGKTRKGDGWTGKAYCGSLVHAFDVLSRRQVAAIGGEYPPEALDALTKALERIEQAINAGITDTHDNVIKAASKVLEDNEKRTT